ncbi:YccF domain-containing protein [Anaerotignum sp.]|uniref:YccF domain-containing protein n=1 Tax=Anaerotignum sp. TaxID=2039241 RepID=UPI00332E3DB6
MSILGNILWLVFGGIFSAIGWFLAGIICCITIIGIPIGLQCFKFAKMVIWPFGTQIDYGNLNSGSIILNVIWILFCGVELAISSLTMGVMCCLTIIGIPFGIQHFKFAGLALLPFGAQIRRFI